MEECSLSSPFLLVFGEPSYAVAPLLVPGTGGGLWWCRVLTEVLSSGMTSLMTSWDIGERLTSCGLGSEQRRLNRRILQKQMKAPVRQVETRTRVQH
jgi:hypothetical protein